jgi:predicted lipoprotein with Yx(FWY)xxD motif
MNTSGNRIVASIFFILLLAIQFLPGCAPLVQPGEATQSASGYGIFAGPGFALNIAYKPGVGNYLTDGNGRTLYYSSQDTVGASLASNATLKTWPIYYAGNISAHPLLDPTYVTYIRVSGGLLQIAYRGWPLYYYAKDKSQGDTLGDGVGGFFVFKVVPLYTVMLGSSNGTGTHFCDDNGMSIYWTSLDAPGTSNVAGSALDTWIPVNLYGLYVVPSSLNVSDFSSITRSDGTQQTTYKGWPLYYYAGDRSGAAAGNGANGVWWAVDPSASRPGG